MNGERLSKKKFADILMCGRVNILFCNRRTYRFRQKFSRKFIYRLIKSFVFLWLLVLTVSCANQLLFDKNEILQKPTTLAVTAQANQTFEVTYSIENSEPTFIGYNLYISTTTIADSDVANLIPYSVEGKIPSFTHESYTSVQQKFTIDNYHEKDGVFEIEKKFISGKTYYFRLCAYSRFGTLSTPSPQISLVAR